MPTVEDSYPDAQRIGPLMLLPELLRELRADPVQVLADCGLPADALVHPEHRIPYGTMGALLAAGARRSGCDHLGLLLGQRLRLALLGLTGELTLCAPTVGDALATFCVHQHLNSRGAIVFLQIEGATAALGYLVYHPSVDGIEHVHDGVLALMLGALRELAGPRWLPQEFMLSRRRPAAVAPYRAAFPGRLRFDAEWSGLRFDAALLRQPLAGADRPRFLALHRQLAAQDRYGLVNDLRRALRVALVRGQLSGDHVAQMLALHRRTLNRRLAAIGSSFRAVLDEVRHDAARHFLQTTRMPLLSIAHALGYGDASAFSRAFKRWAGTPPQRLRRAVDPRA